MGKRPDDLAVIDWQGYQGKEAVFPVCMKSPAVNGRPLRAQMQAAQLWLENLTIVVCDSLNRFNVQGVANGKDYSIELGTHWLEKNIPVVREYFPDVKIIRWEQHIRANPLFNSYLAQVQRLYQSSPAVRQLRDSMSAFYLEAKYKKFVVDYQSGVGLTFQVDEAIQASSDYLDEEFAGDMVYYHLTGGMSHIYWGLYVDDHQIFSRESGMDLPFPQTLAVTSQRLGSSIPASQIAHMTLDTAIQNLGLKAA